MPPKKKTKKVTVNEIYKLFTDLSEAYDIHGDRQRCDSFLLRAETIRNLKSITCGADIAKLNWCGKKSVKIVDEYIETGKCQRLEELLADESNMDFDEILEKREQERTKVLRAMSKQKTKNKKTKNKKQMAKAFCTCPRLCRNFDSPKGCKFGDDCFFAHGERELRIEEAYIASGGIGHRPCPRCSAVAERSQRTSSLCLLSVLALCVYQLSVFTRRQ